jgi:GlcNAc-P-P-Und epimerase
MRILITGASGFIGTNLLEYFIDKGYKVFNIDKEKPKNPDYEKYWTNVDIRNFKDLEGAVSKIKPNYLIHLAAPTDLNEKDGLEYYNTNTLGVENVVKILLDDPGIKRSIFASTMLVNQVGYKPTGVFDYNPSTLYGKSKVIGEKLVFDHATMLDEFCIIRPTSIWGEHFNEPYRNFFDFVLKGRFFHPGNKACNKTYGYIGNVVYQIDQLLFSKKDLIHKQVFYIGDKPAVNISEWANEIAKIAQISQPKKIPYSFFKLAAWFGDLLKIFRVKFPMTSFRLNNMTTDHILNLDNLYDICGKMPYTRKEGVKKTLKWMGCKL